MDGATKETIMILLNFAILGSGLAFGIYETIKTSKELEKTRAEKTDL